MKENIYIFNVLNDQDHYAKCMELILSIEGDRHIKERSETEWFDFLSTMEKENISIDIVFSQNNKVVGMSSIEKANWIENEIIYEKRTNFSAYKHSFAKSLSNMSMSKSDVNRYYYFRVHSNEKTDVVNFLYYKLMLQSQGIPSERMIAFILPACDNLMINKTGICYFKASREVINKTNQYNRFSDFLMLVQQNNIFGTWYDARCNKMKITKLENKKQKGIIGYKNLPKSFIPLFNVNEKTYHDIIQVKHSFQSIETNNYINTKPRFLDIVGEVSIFDKKEGLTQDFFRFANDKLNSFLEQKNIPSHIYIPFANALASCVCDNSGISAMQYLILTLVISRNTHLIKEIMNKNQSPDISLPKYYIAKEKEWRYFWDVCFNEAFDFSDAVSQLFENVVNHSINHCGLATARLYNDKSVQKEQLLQIILADSNREKNIIDTFISNSSKCPIELAKVYEDITISDFLNYIDNYEYWDSRKTNGYWKDFRKNNPEMCQGLLKFSKHISNLNGIAAYRSSIYFNECSEKSMWMYNTDENKNKSYIPGTQISFGLKHNNGVKPSFLPNIHNPVYEGYAKYLDCNIPAVSFNITDIDFDLYNQERKDKYIELYSKIWQGIIEEHRGQIAINVDFSNISKLNNNSHYETIWKGYLKALRELNINDNDASLNAKPNIKFFAFINMSTECFKQLVFTVKLNEEKNLFKYVSVHMTSGRCVDLSNANWEDSLLNEYKAEILPVQLLSPKDEKDFFEKIIDEAAENELVHLTGYKHGYKLSGTHMRLGSKVHLDTFYQMSTFFKKQDMAMHTAFVLSRQILQNNINDAVINKGERNIMLYGYESYSRTVLFCMSEIIKKYFQFKGIDVVVEFSIYQVDRIIGSKAVNEKPYFSMFLDDNDMESIKATLEKFSWILVVPISSTLTTFKKMWAKIKSFYGIDEKCILATLTAFWVVDENNKHTNSNIIKPSNIEKGFWESANIAEKKINMGSNGLKNIKNYSFYMYKKSKWHSPFTCDRCYPLDSVNEFPLLETDASSTVPEQQYYTQQSSNAPCSFEKENLDAFVSLKDCVSYGHIDKNGNHYQYYLDLSKYFQKNKANVKDWLEKLRSEFESSFKNKTLVIVSPQQNTDIEFSLYVSNYLCKGNAVSIMIDSDKHFRSNIETEYADVKEILKDKRDDVFYMYVDTSITSGKGIQRITSLMSNVAYSSPKHFTFDAVILLVNRLSLSSRQQFVRQDNMFQSFLNIKVPHLRTYGDSCVCCKLADKNDEIFRKATTSKISAYFETKKYKNKEVPFNEVTDKNTDKGFIRLAIAHVAATEFESAHRFTGNENEIKGKYFDAIMEVLGATMGKNNIPLISKVMEILDEKCEKCYYLRHAMKVMGRPFFSYVYNEKAVMIDILIILSELIIESIIKTNGEIKLDGELYKNQIKECMDNLISSLGDKQYLYNRRGCLEEMAQEIISSFETFDELADFICGCLFKLLLNLGSNYIIRINTLYNTIRFLSKVEDSNVYEKFYQRYFRYVVSHLKNGQDESKAVRIEYMLRSGKEIQKSQTLEDAQITLLDDLEDSDSEIRKALCDASEKHIYYLVENFIKPLIIENTQVLYKGLKDISFKFKIKDNNTNLDQAQKIIMEIPDSEFHESYITSMYQFLKSEMSYVNNCIDDSHVYNEIRKLLYMYVVISSGTRQSGEIYFSSLKDTIINIVCSVFNAEAKETVVSLFATKINKNSIIINEKGPKIYGVTKDDIFDEKQESEIRMLLDEANATKTLNHFGYYYQENYDSQSHIIIKLDNNTVALSELLGQDFNVNFSKDIIQEIISKKVEIDPVYIYIKVPKIYGKKYNYLFAIRKILSFRYSLVNVIEKDFSNSTMQQKYNAEIAAKLLTVDKAGSHLSNSEFMALQYYLQLSDAPKGEEFVSLKKSEFNTKWLLLYNYTNRRIARLYNKMLAVKYLSQIEELKKGYAEMYVYSVDEEDSHALTNLGKAIKDRNRNSYFETLEKVVTFHIDGEIVEKTDDLIKKLQKFECIQIPSTTLFGQETRMFYSSENFLVCGLLDFCYSAIKRFKNWSDCGLSGSNGIVGIFDYMQRNNLKCDIFIESHYGADCYNGLNYGWLIFKDVVCHEEQYSPIEDIQDEETGMSITTISWYIDTLWECCISENENMDKDSKVPRTMSGEENGVYYIKFPILKKPI